MKHFAPLLFALLVVALLSAFAPARAAERLKVVASIPDLADLVNEIGGERVEVTSIAKGRENLHAVVARPSHLVAMSRADAFFEVGLSLETAFVPGLIEACGNPKVKPGGPGFFNCSEGWQAISVPTTLSRQGGDLHPQGNPHMNLSPRGGRALAGRVLAGLVSLEPASKEYFEKRHADFVKRLDAAQARWNEMAATWKGRKIVEYHQEYNYFADAYGIEILANLEVKPGIPPTPNHLAEVIEAMKNASCNVIVTAQWSQNSFVTRVAEATQAKVIELPNMCGGMKGADTWIGMMDLMHERLAAAFGTPIPDKK